MVSRPGSGITTFTVGSPERDQALLGRLLDAGLAFRPVHGRVGGIRVSTHYYNDEDDVAALLAVVRSYVRALAAVPVRAEVG